ncbi:MAG: XamI family restriction endonuclease [Bacteroidales bacterium]|nr:XamI family restriction endonuclease [Bacteroidales bacterium]
MGINNDKPDLWGKDIRRSVDLYNEWFLNFAPEAFIETRENRTTYIERALIETSYLRDVSPGILNEFPWVLPILRMSTCPPLARDRLVGISGVRKSLVENMENTENPHVSSRMRKDELNAELQKISDTVGKMVDPVLFPWLSEDRIPDDLELWRASATVADRLCGSLTDPIIRNAQEKRQLGKITEFLGGKGYRQAESGIRYFEMSPGTYSLHTNIPVNVSNVSKSEEKDRKVFNVSVDIAVMPFSAKVGRLPLLLELKSAGDFTNVNKRRKEEATKMTQLTNKYGDGVVYFLFLCGYFDLGYLKYEADAGIDWIWEHRIEDMELLGI